MSKVTDLLTVKEIKQLELLIELELDKIRSGIDDKEVYKKILDLGMIKGKLNTMKKNLKKV